MRAYTNAGHHSSGELWTHEIHSLDPGQGRILIQGTIVGLNLRVHQFHILDPGRGEH
jgi:hypothetical protein